jgi:predicted nucleic acid-binding protein
VARWVLDANVAVKWIAPEELSREANIFIGPDQNELIAPDVIIWEALNALVGKAQQRAIPRDAVSSAVPTLYERFDLFDSWPLLEQAIHLALEVNCTLFDGLYLLVALIEECPLVTADQRLVNATRQRYSDVVVPLASFTA